MRGALILAAPDHHRALAPAFSFPRKPGLRSSRPSLGFPLPTSTGSFKSKGYDVYSHGEQDADARCAMSMDMYFNARLLFSQSHLCTVVLMHATLDHFICVFQSKRSGMSIGDFSQTKSALEKLIRKQ